MKINFERTTATRLYTILGSALYLHNEMSIASTDAQKLEALERWMRSMDYGRCVSCLNQMQTEVYCSLAVEDAHIQAQTTALRGGK
jgi:hypothetical protein